MFHLAAYYRSIDGGGNQHLLNAVADQVLTTLGADLRIPRDLPNIIGETFLSPATTLKNAQLKSPSLRRIIDIDIEPIVNASVFGNEPESILHPSLPVPVDPDESLQASVVSDHGSAVGENALVWLSDGAVNTVSGRMFSIRATASATLIEGSWVNADLEFTQVLPAGKYRIVGMRARGANLIAARLVVPGYSWRPGVPAVNAISDRDPAHCRYGGLGVLAEFESTVIPKVDCYGKTDSSQTFILDLMKA